jgi:hypothetical protein
LHLESERTQIVSIFQSLRMNLVAEYPRYMASSAMGFTPHFLRPCLRRKMLRPGSRKWMPATAKVVGESECEENGEPDDAGISDGASEGGADFEVHKKVHNQEGLRDCDAHTGDEVAVTQIDKAHSESESEQDHQ